MSISLKDIHEQITEIANTPSTNDKVDLLRKYLENKRFRNIVWMAYTSTLKFNVKTFPKYKQVGFCDRGWEFVKPILKQLSTQLGADMDIKNKLFQAASIDKETYDIVDRICNGDLKAGFGARLVNKAQPGTIKIMSYMRCATSKYIDRIDFSEYALAQCKADGSFANLFIDADSNLSFVTRNGNPIKCLSYLKGKIKYQKSSQKFGQPKGIDADNLGMFLDRVYMGELRVLNEDGTIMPRKQGNGIISQCIDGTVDPKVAKRIFYTVWDSVKVSEFWNGESEIHLRTRFHNAITLVRTVNDTKYLRLVKYDEVHSLDEAYSFFRTMRAEGEEGAVIKNIDAGWEDNESGSKDQIKLKHSFESDVKVVGWNYGTKGTKYENCMGSVIVESRCGKMRCSVSGFTDEEREWDWDMMIDMIMTVEAESVITSKSKTTASLYTPSFVEVREDKTKADTLEEIIEIARESKKMRRRKA